MTIWHILVLGLAWHSYKRGSYIIKARWQDVGFRRNSFWTPGTSYVRVGDDAVLAGYFMMLYGLILTFATITELLNIHHYTLIIFVLIVLFDNVVVFMIVPPQSEVKSRTQLEGE